MEFCGGGHYDVAFEVTESDHKFNVTGSVAGVAYDTDVQRDGHTMTVHWNIYDSK